MTQRIAVVEDEPMMNDLICFVLNNAGFKTVSYTSARAAQALSLIHILVNCLKVNLNG